MEWGKNYSYLQIYDRIKLIEFPDIDQVRTHELCCYHLRSYALWTFRVTLLKVNLFTFGSSLNLVRATITLLNDTSSDSQGSNRSSLDYNNASLVYCISYTVSILVRFKLSFL